MHRNKRLPVRRTRVVSASSLTTEERADLGRRLFPILRETFDGADEATFTAKSLFRAPDARIALFHGEGDELCGFASASLVRLTIDGIEHAIFDAGVFIDLRYRGGAAAARFGLLEALRLRLANPSLRLWYVTETSSPAPYSLYGQTVAAFYPHPEIEAPSEVLAIVRAFAASRGMQTVGDDPYIVESSRGFRIHDARRVRAARSLDDDAFADFYLRRNPRFEEGHHLLTCMPLDWRNLLAGLLPWLRPMLTRRARRQATTAKESIRALPPHGDAALS